MKISLKIIRYKFSTIFIGIIIRKNILRHILAQVERSGIRKRKMPTPKEIVTNAIEGGNVVIFSKKSCPFCKMAKGVFDKLNESYSAIELDDMKDCDEIQNILEEITGARTVPRVFVKGEFIGGGSDVKKLYESGELQKKLSA